jgi:Haspin like kinase domain
MFKIGEATYSDVYLIDDEDMPQAVKVIPLGGKDHLPIKDALAELNSTKSVSNIKLNSIQEQAYNYIKLYDCALVKSSYDSKLLALWDKYDEENKSENVRPCICILTLAKWPVDQLYLVLFMQFGGTDLEHTTILTLKCEILSTLLQIILAIAQGEEQVEFEVMNDNKASRSTLGKYFG